MLDKIVQLANRYDVPPLTNLRRLDTPGVDFPPYRSRGHFSCGMKFVQAIAEEPANGQEWAFCTTHEYAKEDDWHIFPVDDDPNMLDGSLDDVVICTGLDTDLSRKMASEVLDDYQRVQILTYLYNNGRAIESDLAVMVDGREVCHSVIDTHLPMLVDFGIVERDGHYIVPTEDVDILVESGIELGASISEHGAPNGWKQASERL